MKPELTDEEIDALARLLRDTIEADRYPLSPRVQMWKGILAKIRPMPPKASLAPKGLERNPNRSRLRNIMNRRGQGEIGDGEAAISGPAMTVVNVGAAVCG
jgi:hypothetical protein